MIYTPSLNFTILATKKELMKKYLLLFLALNSALLLEAQTGSANTKTGKKPFTFEVTTGLNRIFFKDPFPQTFYTYYNFNATLNPVNSFIIGIMLNPQLEIGKNQFSVGFGISYGSVNIKQQINDKEVGFEASIQSGYSFIRPDLVARYTLLPEAAIKYYISAGFGFNYLVESKPTVIVDYKNTSPLYFPIVYTEKYSLRSTSINPKIATGIIYKRNRIELAYALPTDVSNSRRFKQRSGYYGLSYYFRITNL
jgi:hypothetical protein